MSQRGTDPTARASRLLDKITVLAGALRRRHRAAALWIILAKAVIVAAILVLPAGLTISLGAAHGVAMVVVLVTAALTVVACKLARMVKNGGHK